MNLTIFPFACLFECIFSRTITPATLHFENKKEDDQKKKCSVFTVLHAEMGQGYAKEKMKLCRQKETVRNYSKKNF